MQLSFLSKYFFSRARSRGVCLALAVVLMFSFAQESFATLYQLPVGKKKSPNGLVVKIDDTWESGFGYRPILIQLTSTSPLVEAKTVTIRLKSRNWVSTTMEVEQDIVMPEGATVATASISFPSFSGSEMLSWDVLVDGITDKSLSLEKDKARNISMGGFGGQPQNAAFQVLIVDDQATLPFTVPNNKPNVTMGPTTRGIPRTGLVYSSSNTGEVACHPNALPTRWIDYTSFECVVIHSKNLKGLAINQPKALEAIMEWVATGGKLWVFDIDYKKLKGELQSVEKNLGIINTETKDDNESVLEHWMNAAEYGKSIAYRNTYSNQWSSKDRTLSQRYDMGLIFVLGSRRDSSPSFLIDSESIKSTPYLEDTDWNVRHGISFTDSYASGEDYLRFLIPGVGLAPVNTFMFLVTVFVVVIGPLNYFFLKRRGRLYLIVITVPLATFLVTSALFSYAVVGDGFGTRIRERSLTLLDQTKGEAVQWARLSYYSGMSPSGGLEFSKNSVIYPIYSENAYGMFGRSRSTQTKEVQWSDKQQLADGWLNSRTPTQYLTIGTRKTEQKIDLDLSSETPSATNFLGATIELLIVQDSNGNLFVGEEIDNKGKATLSAISQGKATSRLRGLIRGNEPELPGTMLSQDISSRDYTSNMGYGDSSVPKFGNYALNQNLMEQRIEGLIENIPKSPNSLHLEDKHYVAIMKKNPHIDTGVKSYTEESSFHVVIGKW